MGAKERIHAIILWRKFLNNPEYTAQIGIKMELEASAKQTEQKEE